MKKKIKYLIVAVVVVAVFVGAYFLYVKLSDKYAVDSATDSGVNNGTTAEDGINNGTTAESGEKAESNPAPTFSVTDVNGNKVNLADMRGKPVVLNFWATWCYYCKQEMPDFQSMYAKYGDKVQFMMVNLTDGQRETVSSAKKHLSSNGYTFPAYFDTASEAATAYGITGIPATYFIDADGNLITHTTGMLSAESLESKINNLLQQKGE